MDTNINTRCASDLGDVSDTIADISSDLDDSIATTHLANALSLIELARARLEMLGGGES